MEVLADQEIPYIYKLFGLGNRIQLYPGRMIDRKKLKYIDVLIIRSVTQVNCMLLYDTCVKFIGTITSGIDHVDKNYLKKCDIKFIYAPGSNAVSVVEYVFAALFWLARRDNFFLRDKVIGIIGVGHIGSLLHQRLNALGVHTLLYDPYVSKIDTNRSWQSLEKLVSESDILTLHTPLTCIGDYPTWHMVNLDILEALPSYTTLINTARGAVIDNAALLKVLNDGKKINVILDVWESEPYLSLPLLSYVDIGTPHIAGYTIEGKIRGITQIYNKYCNYFNIIQQHTYVSFLSSFVIDIKRLDEVNLSYLINSTYDIYKDHCLLRYFGPKFGGFDMLRRCYRSRREWSSVCVSTGKDYANEILINLGFGVVV